MIENSFAVHKFTKDSLIELICPGRKAGDPEVPEQVSYLARYCEQLEAKTIIEESHYMDRHFVDEFASYYSRKLSPPTNSVRRLHFFTHVLTDSELKNWLTRGFQSPDEKIKVQREILAAPEGSNADTGYLGYSAIRPVPSVPVGRTVMCRLPANQTPYRQIWATNRHTVHLGNLELCVDGLAFQQQDAAVGACATVALWSALVRVARLDGMRAPTPAEISDAAVRNSRMGNHIIMAANNGLTVPQLCDATRAFGFSPEVIQTNGRPEALVAALHTYLLSGIPVILALRGSGSGHAVTAVGFQLSPSEHPSLKPSVPLRSARMQKIYIHDDRLGPYARAHLKPIKGPEDAGDFLVLEIEWDGQQTERWLVDCAIAPVYPKIRLSVGALMVLAEHAGAAVEHVVGPTRARDLRANFRYERAGDYLGKLSGRVGDPVRAAELASRVSLSRWCAVVCWYLGEEKTMEFVYDTTDVVRNPEVEHRELLRAIVSLSPDGREGAETIARALHVPWA